MSKIVTLGLLMFVYWFIPCYKPITRTQYNYVAGNADTTFLLKEKDAESYHIVFIEKNRQSEVYKSMLNFKMDKYDKESFVQNYKAVKAYLPQPFKKHPLAHLPKQWLPLYSYKGKYYIYKPSEQGFMGRVTITDSTMMR